MNARRLSAAALVLAVGTMPLVAGNAHAATISKAHAKKLANAAVLTKKDLRGWTATPNAGDGKGGGAADPLDDQMTKCLGLVEPKDIAENDGLDFAKGMQQIQSSSAVATSARTAAAYLTKSVSPKGMTCFKKYFPAELESAGIKVSHLSAKVVSVKVAGADHAIGFHFGATLTTPQGSFPMEFNDLGMLVGHTAIELTGIGVGQKAPKFSQLERLGHTLVKRVHAA